MKTSGLFRVHSLTVKCRLNEPLTLVIFGDVHRDSPNHADGACGASNLEPRHSGANVMAT